MCVCAKPTRTVGASASTISPWSIKIQKTVHPRLLTLHVCSTKLDSEMRIGCYLALRTHGLDQRHDSLSCIGTTRLIDWTRHTWSRSLLLRARLLQQLHNHHSYPYQSDYSSDSSYRSRDGRADCAISRCVLLHIGTTCRTNPPSTYGLVLRQCPARPLPQRTVYPNMGYMGQRVIFMKNRNPTDSIRAVSVTVCISVSMPKPY